VLKRRVYVRKRDAMKRHWNSCTPYQKKRGWLVLYRNAGEPKKKRGTRREEKSGLGAHSVWKAREVKTIATENSYQKDGPVARSQGDQRDFRVIARRKEADS